MKPRKPKRSFFSVDTALALLFVACVVLTAFLAYAGTFLLIPAMAIIIVVSAVLVFTSKTLRKQVRAVIGDKEAPSNAINSLGLPVAIVDNSNNVIWQNTAFMKDFTNGKDAGVISIDKLVPTLDTEIAMGCDGQDVEISSRLYTIYASNSQEDAALKMVVFVENTELKHNSAEYYASRPTVIYIVIDTFDEVLKEMRESERARIMTAVDDMLEKYIGTYHGLLRRVSNSRYLAVVEQRHFEKIIEHRFEILDTIHTADADPSTVSLSIGAGHMGDTFKICEEMALQALDMALGRGGDQAAVRESDGSFTFYGGASRSIEKRTKVKSRIVASAIKELVSQSDRVLIMGHKNSDMDSIGAAVGMLRFCRICQKPAAIVFNRQTTLARNLVDTLEKAGYGDNLLTPDQALSVAGKRTLLIVVDTHMKSLIESLEIYASCYRVVVIDHHRKMVGHIDNAVVFYHEPYASSASELVTELLQYVGDGKDRITPVEAEALLAGIMLDTRTFSLHVGVRTFEAAAYLRKMGAQTANVKKLFATTMDSYLYRIHLVSEAQVHEGVAVVISDKIPSSFDVVAQQAANDLLTIDGVKASVVAVRYGNEIRVSARSMGDINVQLIMEKLGGGGHLTMAGAQLEDVSNEKVQELILQAITDYNNEHTKKLPPGKSN